MTDTATLSSSPLDKRIHSVDIMRGLTILAMAFVNDLSDLVPVNDVPQWLRHMEKGMDGFTLVDTIIPIFMFLVGISIPLALRKRLKRNESTLSVFSHVLMRTISLLIMGLMDVNRWEGSLGESYGMMSNWPLGLWKFLAWTFIFMVWLDFPIKSKGAEKVGNVMRIAGFMGLIWLAVVFRTSSGGHFTTSWWATLGQIGWAYLFGSITWLIFRNNRLGIFGAFMLMHCLYLGLTNGLFEGVWLVDFIGKTALGTYSTHAVAGLFIGTLLSEQSAYKDKIRWALGLALFTFTAAIFLRPIGGLHLPSTSWSLCCTGIALVLWTLFYWCTDVRGWTAGLNHVRIIGKNTLLLYQLARYGIFLYWLSGLTFYDSLAENTTTGIMRAAVYTFVLGAITVFATKKRVLLRV